MVLDITVEHGLPELHCGPHHVLLYTAVSKLSNASAQFLSDKKNNDCHEEAEYQITRAIITDLS